jgi:hypothetical protein
MTLQKSHTSTPHISLQYDASVSCVVGNVNLVVGPSITVVEPHDMTTWVTGTIANISWSTTGMIAASPPYWVRIELFVDRAQSPKYVQAITHSTPALTSIDNMGSFYWNATLPAQYGAATWFKVHSTSSLALV